MTVYNIFAFNVRYPCLPLSDNSHGLVPGRRMHQMQWLGAGDIGFKELWKADGGCSSRGEYNINLDALTSRVHKPQCSEMIVFDRGGRNELGWRRRV